MNPIWGSTNAPSPVGRRWAWTGAAVALGLGVALAGGCLFQPREAEQPEERPPVEFEQPTAPEIALSNIEKTLEAQYLQNYVNSFSQGELIMEMDPGEYWTTTGGTNPFPNWTREQEAARMQDVLSSMGADGETELDVIWDEDPGSKWRSGDENYYEDLEYQLVFSAGQVVRAYAGRVNLYFKQDGANYYIWKWIDEQASGGETRSWCYLRYVGTWNPAGGG